jgi:hypothetical protein
MSMSMIMIMIISSLPIRAFQWQITSSITITYVTYLA